MSSVAEEIARLNELLKQGVLTPEEFGDAKRALLGSISSGGGSPRSVQSSTLTRLGSYDLKGVLGQGGMGVVYRACHRTEAMAARQGGDVAVKVVLGGASEGTRARLAREGDLGGRLSHPHLVRVLDVVEEGDQVGIVMEMVEGRSLRELLTGVPWDWRGVCTPAAGLLEGLALAHRQGVVHRDIKPGNILVDGAGRWRLSDFGLAKDTLAVLSEGLTQSNARLGTISYMSPEQMVDPKRVDARADVYAVGLVLYEALAGGLPWADRLDLLTDYKRQGLPALPVSVPAPVAKVVMEALRVDPASRPGTAGALATGLALAVRESERVRPDSSVDARREARLDRDAIVNLAGDTEPIVQSPSRETSLGLTASPRAEPRLHGSASSGDVVPRAEPLFSRYATMGPKARPTGMVRLLVGLGAGTVLILISLLAFEASHVPDENQTQQGGPMEATSVGPPGRSSSYPMVRVAAGAFVMGCREGDPVCMNGDNPARSMEIPRNFLLGSTEVSQVIWREVMAGNPSQFTDCGGDCPVERVSWCDAIVFANLLSEYEGIAPAYSLPVGFEAGMPLALCNSQAGNVRLLSGSPGYRLPTEAEWEYAARAGTDFLFAGGNDMEAVAWTESNSGGAPHPTKGRMANSWGLFDMSGNVSEWVWDSAVAGQLGGSASPGDGRPMRIIRGGSWSSSAAALRVVDGGQLAPGTRVGEVGLRLARSIP